jgi:hypothetical protein
MTELRWPRETTFRDTSQSPVFVARGPGVYDAPDDRIETYLNRGWIDPSADDDSESGDSGVDTDSEDVSEEEDAIEDEDDIAEFDAAASFVDRTPVSDVRDDIETGSLTDEQLEAIAEAERERSNDGEGRATVMNTIAEQRSDTGDGGDSDGS